MKRRVYPCRTVLKQIFSQHPIIQDTCVLSTYNRLSSLFLIRQSLSIWSKSYDFILGTIITFLSLAISKALLLTFSCTKTTWGFSLKRLSRKVLRIFSQLTTISSNLTCLFCMRTSASIGGLTVTTRGNLKCVSIFLAGILFSMTKPLTQAAATAQVGANIVSTLISWDKLNGSFLIKIQVFVSLTAFQAISVSLISQVAVSRSQFLHSYLESQRSRAKAVLSILIFCQLMRERRDQRVFLCSPLTSCGVRSGSQIYILEIVVSMLITSFNYGLWLLRSLTAIYILTLQGLQCLSFFQASQPMSYPLMTLAAQSLQKTSPQKRQWCFQTTIGTKLRRQPRHLLTVLSSTQDSLGQSSYRMVLASCILQISLLIKQWPIRLGHLPQVLFTLYLCLCPGIAINYYFPKLVLSHLMQIEDEQPSTLSLHELLADKQNRVKVIRIVYQALKSMGYTQTALELITESDIQPEEETESIIKALFEQKQYQKVTGIVEQLHIQSSKKAAVSRILTELQVMQLIQEKQYQAAIQRVMSVWPQDQEKQLFFLSMIATGQPISPEQFQNRHNQVLQHCITESFQLQNNIKKLLKGYLSASVFDKRSLSEEQPFKKIVAESDKLQGMGKPSFLKLHPKADSICMISQSSRQTHVSIWSINGSKISLKLQWKQENFGSVGSVCWDEQGRLLAFNSTTKLAICDTMYQLKPIVILESQKLLKAKQLCCRWDSNGLLYVGGMAEAITALDNHGKIVRTIRPFMKTRDMVFNSKDELYAISATNGVVVKYNLLEEKIINSFKANNCFMDLYLNEQAQTLVVTNQQYIHLLDPVTLEEKMNVLSPHNERLYKIEAFFTQNWLFVYNQKLTAVLQNHLVTRHHIWPDCDAIDVRGNKMVTAKMTLMIWQPEDTAVESIQPVSLNNRDNSQDIEWYSQVLEQDLDQHLQEMHSLSSNSNSQEEVEENSESQDQQNPVQIEYLQNQSDESEESDPEQA